MQELQYVDLLLPHPHQQTNKSPAPILDKIAAMTRPFALRLLQGMRSLVQWLH